MSKVKLIKFGAEWCGPCRMQAPVIEQLAKEYDGKVEVIDVDIDEPPQDDLLKIISTIRAIPVTIIFKDGTETKRFQGFQTKETLKNALNEVL